MASGSNWFYVADNERKGPIQTAAMTTLLDSNTISETTLVWTEGMADWAPLRDTPLYKGPAIPPALSSLPFADGDTPSDPPVRGLGEAIATCFRKYATFSGRANWPEFWWFMLFNWLATIAASIIDSAVFGNYGKLSLIVTLGLLLPNLAVSFRRLQDTDRNGWWILLHLVPLGTIILIVWFCGRGTPRRNRFG